MLVFRKGLGGECSDYRGKRQVSNLSLRITDYGLRITDYGLRITDYGLRITDYGLRITDYGLRITDYFSNTQPNVKHFGIP